MVATHLLRVSQADFTQKLTNSPLVAGFLLIGFMISGIAAAGPEDPWEGGSWVSFAGHVAVGFLKNIVFQFGSGLGDVPHGFGLRHLFS